MNYVIEEVSRTFPNLVLTKPDAEFWTGKALEANGSYEHFCNYTKKIPVVNGVAKVPRGTYRILMSGSTCNQSEFHSGCFHVAPGISEITLNYLGLPTSADGELLIDEGFIQAAAWYCVKMLLLEPYLQGTITKDRFDYVSEQYRQAHQAAKGSYRNFTSGRLARLNADLRSFVVTPSGNEN